MTTIDTYHVPVLLDESINGLNLHPDGVYIDVTFGGERQTGTAKVTDGAVSFTAA